MLRLGALPQKHIERRGAQRLGAVLHGVLGGAPVRALRRVDVTPPTIVPTRLIDSPTLAVGVLVTTLTSAAYAYLKTSKVLEKPPATKDLV